MKTNTKQSLIALLTAASMAAPLAFAEGEPENVFNVSATPKDATTLEVTWDSALDAEGNAVAHYRIYYGVDSVQGGDAEAYEATVDTPDSSTNYDLGSLDTGVAYYLSVTAVDTSDLESPEYSIETSAIPSDEAVEAEDAVAPTVVNVIAADKTHVLVGFSEEVKLPELLAEAAFTITEQINPANILEVTAAELYADDPMNKTVVLTTAEQTKNVNYIMTASVAIVDLAGNPIESGNTDSGLFLGSDEVSETFGDAEIVVEEETTDVPVPELIAEDEEEEDVTPP
ncbi:MAG: fibronectin type III domain-containing protein, partial [Candidatus Peregrinibacteria bacterium]|nr:fibronectin type III domain-containing protein [Candidatus Peregrinibacteria bacterium]